MLPKFLTPYLSLAAAPVITKALTKGGLRTVKPTGEVSAVRTMTLDGFDEIAKAWSPIVGNHGYRIDLRTVFCHSSPQVKFKPLPHPNYTSGNNPRQCELADLLIVVDHIDHQKKIDTRRAVLIQAKMLKGGALKPTGQEWVQHELLAWLIPFEFVDQAYDSRIRKLGFPGVGFPTLTAEYAGLDIGSASPEWRHELTQTTTPWFRSPISLAEYFASMATGAPSCGRKAIPGGMDDWSFTVDELLRVTAARPISTNFCVDRGSHRVAGLFINTSPVVELKGTDSNSISDGSNGSGSAGDFMDTTTSDRPSGPISTVHMTVKRIEDSSVD